MITARLANLTSDNLNWLQENLQLKYAFQLERIQIAFAYSLAATLGIVIALIVASALNLHIVENQDHLYSQFREWHSDTDYTIGPWYDEISLQFERLYVDAKLVGTSIVSDDHFGNISGIARLCTIVAVSIAAAFAYRRRIEKYYGLNVQPAELEDFQNSGKLERMVSRVFYTLATLFGTYVVVSIVWLGLSFAFKELTLDWFSTCILIVGFTGALTFIAVFGALAVTTRGILLLGLMTFGLGLATSFALAKLPDGSQWWTRAVSTAGQYDPSAPVFTGTLLSGSLALVVLWFDVNGLINKFIVNDQVLVLNANQWMWVARTLYVVIIVGLLFVAFIRVGEAHPNNSYFHTGGAVAAIASVVFFGLVIRKRFFPAWYKFFSLYILFGVAVVLGLLGSIKLNPLQLVKTGDGIIGLTVIELVVFMLMGLWAYLTVDNLLTIENISALAAHENGIRAGASSTTSL